MELSATTIITALAGVIATMAVTFFKVCMKVWKDFKVMHNDQLQQQRETHESYMEQRKEELNVFTGKFDRVEERQIKQLAIAIDTKEQARELKHAQQNLNLNLDCVKKKDGAENADSNN